MKTTATTSSIENDLTRCVHNTSHGHRCRMPSIEESRYCAAHHRLPNPRDFSLANELAQAAGSLSSPEKVDRALAKVFLAVAEDRIEPRKAYLLGFLAQTLLRGHQQIAAHRKIDQQLDAAHRNMDPFQEDFPSDLRDRAIKRYLAMREQKESPAAATSDSPQA